MDLEWKDLTELLLFAIFVLATVSGISVITKAAREKSKAQLLGVLILLIGTQSLTQWLYYFGNISAVLPEFKMNPFTFYYLNSILFYHYVLKITGGVKNRKGLIALYVVPGIEFLVLSFLFIRFQENIFKSYEQTYYIFYGVLIHIFSLGVLTLALIRLFAYEKGIKQAYSDLEGKRVRWAKITAFCLCFLYAYYLFSAYFLYIFVNPYIYLTIDAVLTIFVIQWMSHYGIKQSPPKESFDDLKELSADNSEDGLSAEDEKIFIELEWSIVNDRHFKNGNLKIADLSQVANLPAKQISKLINQSTGKNFNQYINEFRINFAERLLKDEKYDQYSVEGIAQEAGFNSKSVFNSLFKSKTGKTPSEFRKSR